MYCNIGTGILPCSEVCHCGPAPLQRSDVNSSFEWNGYISVCLCVCLPVCLIQESCPNSSFNIACMLLPTSVVYLSACPLVSVVLVAAQTEVIKSSRKAAETRNGSGKARPEPLKHSSHCSEAL